MNRYMKKTVSIIFMMLLFVSASNAQKAVIQFQEKIHDFGQIKEEDGKVSYQFKFTNTGTGPLVISRVQASCGCTTPNWTKEPIEPGNSGSIMVTYNPLGRPGIFNKTITVFSNATEEQVQLQIKGEVIPKTDENSDYPISMSGIRLKTKIVQMNNVNKGTIQSRSISFKNTTSQNVRITFENLPSYVTSEVIPDITQPNEEGKITFYLNSKNCQQWGPISDDFYLIVNGQKKFSEDNKLTLYANIVEDFSKLSVSERQNAPILDIPSTTLSLGTFKAGSKVSGKFLIKNIGKDELKIHRIINNNKELTVSSVQTIKGGSKGELKVTVNTANLASGNYKKTITLQTNDPNNSFVILVVNWTIS